MKEGNENESEQRAMTRGMREKGKAWPEMKSKLFFSFSLSPLFSLSGYTHTHAPIHTHTHTHTRAHTHTHTHTHVQRIEWLENTIERENSSNERQKKTRKKKGKKQRAERLER